MPTTPPSITTLPSAPDPNNRATFNALAYPWSAALPTFGTQVSAVATNVKANADEAEADAVSTAADRVVTTADRIAAAASASTATTQAGNALTSANNAAASAAAAAGAAAFVDTNPVVKGSVDATKQIRFEVDGLTTATTRVLTVPDADLTLVGVATTQTLTNKTISASLINESRGTDIASAGTINLTTATGNAVDVTGTTTITAITLADGAERTVRFTGALTLTNGSSLVLPGAANITTAAGDFAVFRGYAAGVVRCENYVRANGTSVASNGTGTGTITSVAGSRSFGTTYTNTGTTTRWVSVVANLTIGSGTGIIYATANSNDLVYIQKPQHASISQSVTLFFPVPPGATYVVTSGALFTKAFWFEFQ